MKQKNFIKIIFIKKRKLPYVIGKIACSSNYYILKNKKILQMNILKTYLIY